ncbi:GH116 family glycosyl hydrolase [Chitinophaga sp. MM2321]|uniref:GH116 family glycosyl hydrolase n=1 Tax=Chitinophaga sp. MM2321 TaxID=3137178 RepID=UPI0032D58C35
MNNQIPRRSFLRNASLLAAGVVAIRFPLWARSPWAPGMPVHNIPFNKGIDTAWLKSLYEQGNTTSWLKSRNELKYIGMPVGGLHAGTVYLGGDGRLWLWQIYNETMEPTHEGIDPKTVNWNDGNTMRKIRSRDGSAYIEPAIADNRRILDQGFAIQIIRDGTTWIKELNEEHWDEISFEPAYPTALVTYSSKDFPVTVQLKAYAPFIPLDADNSSLPATILRLEVKNTSDAAMDISLLGWLENGANKLTAKTGKGKRRNQVDTAAGRTSLFFDYDTQDAASLTATDSGNMCLTLHGAGGKANTSLQPWPVTTACFEEVSTAVATQDAPDKLVGGIVVAERIAAGQALKADFSVTWYFNQLHPKLKELVADAKDGYYYAAKFKDALAVSKYLAADFNKLTTTTDLWQQTWYGGTLPDWFLQRTFINIGTLATANTYRFSDGRFWGWEGVGACRGTCTHVWHYAQSVARIFPELERDLRARVDLGTGFKEDSGAILFRGETEKRPAIDGQAGTILRFYREHQMSKDDTFLRTNWPKMKKAIGFMLAQDSNGDGLTDTPMQNTLDAVWEGEIAWIAGLCIAAAGAAQAMATEAGDHAFAGTCATYVEKGRRNMETMLFNGEYFIHRPDAVLGRAKLGAYNTCHIDQVLGQSWAFQVGLPRVLDKEKTVTALKALWKYNFTMDVGPYIKTHTGGRPYALAGEGGMIMNTNPHNEPAPYGDRTTWQLGYFHECMSGFEHQVAAHLMAEGMVDESLVLTRVIHDRYHPAKRNPFNEIECSDHYARAMASYGTFINACGFEYHGPKGYIAFAPRIQPEKFKAAFTAAEGWGTYSQWKEEHGQQHAIKPVYGSLRVKEMAFERMGGQQTVKVMVKLNGTNRPLRFKTAGNKIYISLAKKLTIQANETLEIMIA